MLKSKSLPNFLWGEVVETTTHVVNRRPTKRLQEITWASLNRDQTRCHTHENSWLSLFPACSRSDEEVAGWYRDSINPHWISLNKWL